MPRARGDWRRGQRQDHARVMGAMWRIAVSPDGLWEATEGSYRCGGWEWSSLM